MPTKLLPGTKEYREYMRIWRDNHRERYKQYLREWRRKNNKKSREWCRKRYHQHKEQYQAKAKVRTLPLASSCELCGAVEDLQKHHPDYTFPKTYITCCRTCHSWIHHD